MGKLGKWASGKVIRQKKKKKLQRKDSYRGQLGKFTSLHLFYSRISIYRIYISISDLFTYQSAPFAREKPWNSGSRTNDQRRERKSGSKCRGRMKDWSEHLSLSINASVKKIFLIYIYIILYIYVSYIYIWRDILSMRDHRSIGSIADRSIQERGCCIRIFLVSSSDPCNVAIRSLSAMKKSNKQYFPNTTLTTISILLCWLG